MRAKNRFFAALLVMASAVALTAAGAEKAPGAEVGGQFVVGNYIHTFDDGRPSRFTVRACVFDAALANGQVIEYALVTLPGGQAVGDPLALAPAEGWQINCFWDTEFTDPVDNYVFARFRENDDYAAGPPSVLPLLYADMDNWPGDTHTWRVGANVGSVEREDILFYKDSIANAQSITITRPVEPPATGQDVEYAVVTVTRCEDGKIAGCISDVDNPLALAPDAGWQKGLTFDGLPADDGVEYYVFARSSENSEYAAGPASVVVVSDAGGASSISFSSRTAAGGRANPLVTVRGRTLNVKSAPNAAAQVRLIDMKGRTAAKFSSKGGNATFSLARLPAGRYLAEVRQNGKRVTSAFVLR